MRRRNERAAPGRAAHRIVAALGVLALALAGVAVASPALAAAPGDVPVGPYTLTITKAAQPADVGTDNGGAPLDASDLDTLSGVTFTVRPVTSIDLTAASGWQSTDGLTAKQVLDDPARYPLGTGRRVTTGADGVATLTTDRTGVYLVTETDAGPNDVVSESEPFLVSLPFPHDGGWLTTVDTYPKNSLGAVSKTVDDAGATGLGSVVRWAITADVPHLGTRSLDEFVVGDHLDARLRYDGANPVSVAWASGASIPSSFYAVTARETAGGSTALAVRFTAAGLAALADHQGERVVVTVPTTVVAVGDGTITNSPLVTVNGHTVTGSPARTLWGAVRIEKFDAGKTPLSGAAFRVYTSAKAAAAGSSPVAVLGENTFTTGADGAAMIDGLRAGTYYLVESRAPEGYAVAYTGENPYEFTVGPASLRDPVVLQVHDERLPASGASGGPIDQILAATGSSVGAGLLAGGGLALIAVVAGALVLARRRRAAAAKG